LASAVQQVNSVFHELDPILKTQDRVHLSLFISNDLNPLLSPFLDFLSENTTEQRLAAEQTASEASAAGRWYFVASATIMLGGLLLAGFLGVMVYRSISQPVGRMADTIKKVNDGDLSVRAEIKGSDEISMMAQAFDGMLEDKVATFAKAQEENERLNASVIGLLQAVSKLSQRDLTVKVPVSEDVTGPVADALNLLAGETAHVLHGVRRVSEEVARTSVRVQSLSEIADKAANTGETEVASAAEQLEAAAKSMNEIAALAKYSSDAADRAIATTHKALETVTSTVGGINGIRDVIRETEKRIKRLGERSQEISGVVNLINSIAERTHILALNASMHAASAGEAGRGFAVVADEVQRLAENARDATSQIATLVSNIQLETSDTVSTMNQVISEVVNGSELAEKAGKEMQETRETTEDLVASVRKIATTSQEQASSSNELRDRARQIQESAQETSRQLKAQTGQTSRLVHLAKGLLRSVQVFRLPDSTAGDDQGSSQEAA
jgi:methyl-accepting chemotaxis protein